MSNKYLGSSRRIAADYLRDLMQTEGPTTGSLSHIFEEEPPPLDVFLYDKKYLNSLRPTLPIPDETGHPFRVSDIQWEFLREFEQIFHPDLYIAMVEEFGQYWIPRPMKNEFAISWGKACLVAGEKVYNAENGRWTNVEDLVKDHKVLAVDPTTNKLHRSSATPSWVNGRGECVEITTQTGAKTRVYLGHRFLTPGGWVAARNLKVGDTVANATNLTISNPVTLPIEHVELLGYWLGDDSVSTSQNGITRYFNSYEKKSISRYVGILQTLGLTSSVIQSKGNGVKVTEGTNRTVCSNDPPLDAGPLTNIARAYGIQGSTTHSKRIPEAIFSLPDSQLEVFLARLWGTDGWVEKDRLGYTSVSEEMVRGIALLLKRLGIRSVLRKKKTSGSYEGEKKYSHAWDLVIATKSDIYTFNQRIYLLDRRDKQEALSPVSSAVPRESGEDIVWDTIKSISSIGEHDFYDLSVPGLENYVSTDGLVGHNSGKDTSVRLGFVRIASLLQHLVSPQSYYEMASFDTIHMLNVAATAQQARDAFFDPMKRLFKSNKHLSSLFEGDDPADGANRIKLKKNVLIISGHSVAENQEGLNLIAAVADEISAFKVAEEYANKGDGRSARGAEQIVGMITSSAKSRFPKTYKVAQISWPRFAGDAIEKAIAQGRAHNREHGEQSHWYVSGPHATWEVNPKVSEEDFAADFEADPEGSNAKYRCRPPKSTNVFIRDEMSIDQAFSEIKPDPIHVEYYWGLPPNEGDMAGLQPKEGWQVRYDFSADLIAQEGAMYCLHSDMAIKGDRAGVAMSHVKSYRQTHEAEERPVIKNDFWFTFESKLDEDPPREVQIRWYRQLIWELIERGFYIAKATWDQFQSTDMLQTLNMYGIDAGLLSLDRNDRVYQTFKDVILDHRLESYRAAEDEESLVMREIKRLRKVGKKVDHLPSFSKDASDALAGSVFNAIQAGGQEESEPLPLGGGGYDAVALEMYGGMRNGRNSHGLFGQGWGGGGVPGGMIGNRGGPPPGMFGGGMPPSGHRY